MAEIKTKSVKLNMVMNALLSMSSFIFPLITFPYVSRILLPVGTGRVAFATAVVTYFAMFAQLGIPTYGIRLCAKVRDNKEELTRAVHELLFINLFMSAIVYAVFFISLAVVPKFREEHTLLLIIGATILLNALGVEWLYKALEQYTYITVRSLIFKVVALISTFMLVRDPGDCLQYGFLTILATSASNVLNFINLRKYIYLKPIGGYHIRRHIKMILVFFSMSVATTIYTNLDNVMLGFMKDKVEVGYYSAAVKIKSIMVSVVTSASTVLLPRASYYVDKGMMDEFSRILKKTMHFIFLVAIPFSIYFMIYAKEGIFFLSGKAYAGAIIPMQIIMPTLTDGTIRKRKTGIIFRDCRSNCRFGVKYDFYSNLWSGRSSAWYIGCGGRCVRLAMCSDPRSENGDISEASIWKDSCRSRTWKCRIFLGKIARSRNIPDTCDICSLLFWRVWNCDDCIERFIGN